jgi:conjugative relaxase-like TrwC/TraI family protein
VLKIHVVHAGGHPYYLAGRDQGTELEEPGVWTGPASASLGLVGEVEPDPFTAVMDGRDPRTEDPLRRPRGRRPVEAYDLTFCAPKSVSLLQALAPTEIADAALGGHHRAVADAGAYLSRQAVGVRRMVDGTRVSLPSTGLVAGEFRHRVSRALDPHLHTHLVVANTAQGPDGGWSAIDGRRLFGHLRTAGRLYHARLRLELSERLGAQWEVRPSGFGDVVGVDRRLRRLFSQRTAAIDEYVMVHAGLTTSRSPVVSAVTRPPKVLDASVTELADGWRARAADFGFDLGELGRVVGRARRPAGRAGPRESDRLVDALTDHRHRPGWVVSRPDLVAAVAAGSVRGAAAADVEAVVDRLTDRLAPDHTLARARDPRWRADDVAALVRRRGAERMVESEGPDRSRPRGPVSDRGPGREAVRGRDGPVARLRRQGPGLER